MTCQRSVKIHLLSHTTDGILEDIGHHIPTGHIKGQTGRIIVSSRGRHGDDDPGPSGSDDGSSSRSRNSSRRTSTSSIRDSGSNEGQLAQALIQSTAALAANQAIYGQLQAKLGAVLQANQILTEANQANRATSASLVQRLQSDG